MSTAQVVNARRGAKAISAQPTWWTVFKREMADLWIGGKGPVLLLVYGVLLGILSYVLASNSELSLIPPKEMVYETLKTCIEVGVFIGLILGADTLSGERERNTLESLLLTPASRRQIVLGKFLAAVTPWFGTLAISAPFYAVLAQGDAIFPEAMFWGGIVGTLAAIAWTGVGALVSFWCNNNRASFAVSLGIFLLFFVPTQLPGKAQTGVVGGFLQWVNPSAGSNHFLSKILTNNRTLQEYWTWLIPPVVFAVVVLSLLFLYAAPGLRLTGGKAGTIRSGWRRVAQRRGSVGLGLLVAACLVSLNASPVMARGAEQVTPPAPVEISIDTTSKLLKATESMLFKTTVTNRSTEPAPPLILAMNIINLNAQGEIVDPEDWSPQRTQYEKELAPGQSATHSWQVNAILDGDYMVYMVVIPAPNSQETTSRPVASSGIHLRVMPYTPLNPSGVLPYSIGMPIALGLGVFLINRFRRRQIDMGGS